MLHCQVTPLKSSSKKVQNINK